MESDDGAISRSAHLMVGTLAGSLAHVTSKVILLKALQVYIFYIMNCSFRGPHARRTI